MRRSPFGVPSPEGARGKYSARRSIFLDLHGKRFAEQMFESALSPLTSGETFACQKIGKANVCVCNSVCRDAARWYADLQIYLDIVSGLCYSGTN